MPALCGILVSLKNKLSNLNLFKNEYLESYIIAIVLIMKIFV